MSNTIFANARAKAKEKFLLGTERINRLMESNDIEEALKILSEINFGGEISLASSMDFEFLLNSETHKLFSFIREECPLDALKSFILLPNDYHNGQSIIVEKYLKISAEEYLVEDGLFSAKSLKEKIMSDNYDKLTFGLKNALRSCDELFVDKNATGSVVGSIFTKYLFDDLYKIAKHNRILSEAIKIKADLTNISSAVRLKDFNIFKPYFVSHGNIKLNDFKFICENQIEDIIRYFKGKKSFDLINLAFVGYKNGEPLTRLEKEKDSILVKILLKKKYDQSGVIPFMQYCYYKMSDIDNARIILVGIINKQDKEKIKERLRLSYEW